MSEHTCKDEIKKRVDSWFWNLSIFDIYDEIKDEDEYTQAELLNYAMDTVDEGPARTAFRDLAYHLDVIHLCPASKKK